MSFKKKYWYTFKDLKNTKYTVEIWQDTTGTLTAQEIRGDENPFLIQYSDVSKFDIIRGSGCELNLLSETDRQFYNLYTADMMEFKLKVYKENSLIWLGYLDSELYSEPFNEIKNYPVRFSGTDGFALLERMNYLDTSGNKYIGLDTQWNVIKNILLKLGLEWNNLFISLSTTSNNFSIGSNETIFHKTYLNNQNWYNEDNDPETCRDVLEHILKIYGCFIIQDNASLYIVDVNTIAKGLTTSFKKFDSSFNYVSTVDLNLNLGDISTIKFAESNQQLNVIGGFNKQVITYSPYIKPEIINFDAKKDFSSVSTSTTYGTSPYQWTESIYNFSDTWTASGLGKFAGYVGANIANEDKSDYYLKLTKYPTNQAVPTNISFTYKKELPNFIPADCKLKVNMKGYVRTVDDLEGTQQTDKIIKIKLRTRLKIGNVQYYNNVWNINGRQTGWISSTSTDYDKCFQLDFEMQEQTVEGGYYYSKRSILDNKWIDLKILSENGGGGIVNKDIQLELYSNDLYVSLNSGFSGGQMSFEIYDWDIVVSDPRKYDYSTTKDEIKDIRIKDIEFTIVDNKGNEIKNEDVEYIGYMNAKFKNEGDEMKIYNGTSKIQNPIERGALMGYSGTTFYYLSNWTREGKTDCIENLLLRSVVSNYTNKTIELSCSINRINSIVGSLTYQSFIPNKVFMVVGCTHDLAENISEIKIQEINIDNLEISKSW